MAGQETKPPGQGKPLDDIARLRKEYSDRDKRLAGSDIYSWLNPAHLFTMQQRQRDLLNVLKRHGVKDLSRRKLLEMGCGSGGVLKEFLLFGAPACSLHGVDLLGDSLAQAACDLPGSALARADGQALPFPDRSFYIVLPFPAISS